MQVLAFQILHSKKGLAFVLTVLVHGDNVFVAKIACNLGFVAKPAQHVGAARGEDFDGDLAAYGGVEGAVDAAESSTAELAQNLISANLARISVGHRRRSSRPSFAVLVLYSTRTGY